MKLLNGDFKKVMAGYKAIKTTLKSTDVSVTLLKGFALVAGSGEDEFMTQLLVDIDSRDYSYEVNLDKITCDLLNKCKAKEDLDFTDKVYIGSRSLPYSGVDNTPKPIDISSYLQKFTCKASLFKEQLKGVVAARAKEDSRPVLFNVLLEDSTLIAVDGFRIFTRKIGNMEHIPMLLQPHTVNILLKLLPNKGEDILNIYVAEDVKSYCISWGDYTLIDQLGEGEFLKWQQVFSDDYEYKVSINRKELVEALEFALNSSQENKVPVKFIVKENTLQVGQDALELVEKEFTPHLNAHFKELLIAFNAKYFLESIKDLHDECVLLRFISSLTPCIIGHNQGKDLILPIRLKDN